MIGSISIQYEQNRYSFKQIAPKLAPCFQKDQTYNPCKYIMQISNLVFYEFIKYCRAISRELTLEKSLHRFQEKCLVRSLYLEFSPAVSLDISSIEIFSLYG